MIALPFVGIDVVLIVLWTIAAALAIALVMKKVGAVFSNVPVVGKYIADAASSVAQAITNACGSLMGGIESAVGGALHWVARHFDTWLNQFVSHAVVLAHLAQIVGNAVYDVSGLKALVRSVGYVAHTALRLVDKLEREFKGIEAGVKKLERELATGIGHDLRIQIKALEREWDTFRTKELPAIEADVGALGNDVATAERWVAKNFVSDAELATEATAAAILAAAGVSWLRCNSNPFNNNTNACGLWGDLANLLAIAAIDAATLASLYELIGIAQDVTPTVTGLASDLLKV